MSNGGGGGIIFGFRSRRRRRSRKVSGRRRSRRWWWWLSRSSIRTRLWMSIGRQVKIRGWMGNGITRVMTDDLRPVIHAAAVAAAAMVRMVVVVVMMVIVLLYRVQIVNGRTEALVLHEFGTRPHVAQRVHHGWRTEHASKNILDGIIRHQMVCHSAHAHAHGLLHQARILEAVRVDQRSNQSSLHVGLTRVRVGRRPCGC